MLAPQLTETEKQTMMTEVFLGYNHNLELADGEFYDMENLSADDYPLLAPRPRRGTAQAIEGVQGILAKDALCWVQDQVLYINGASMEAYMPSVSISAGQKQLISMGAYLCIFPDGIYFNTEKYSDNGYMGQENVVDAASSNVEISLCLVDGTALTVSYSQASQPESPSNGQYWLDTSGKLHTLKQWAEATSQWVSVPTVYLKLSANGIGKGFQQYDGIRLSGLTGNEQVEKLNGSQILYDVGESYIVIVGLVDETTKVTSGTVKTARKVPSMDFITESGNRLWGCKYGVADGETVNEIYCCKLGDFKNWECYQGVSTDSWRASCGTDGKWTGAATLADSPIFFKEDCFHRVYPSAAGHIRWSCRSARACRMGLPRASSWWMTSCITNRGWAFACTTGVCRRRSAAASGRSCITTPWRAAPEESTSSAWRMKVITGRCSSTTRKKACGTGRTIPTRRTSPGWTMSCISREWNAQDCLWLGRDAGRQCAVDGGNGDHDVWAGREEIRLAHQPADAAAEGFLGRLLGAV